MTKFPDSLTIRDKETLTAAPVLVYVLLAATSGETTDAQQKAFVAILKGADAVPSETLSVALEHARQNYESIRSSLVGRSIDPAMEFDRVNDILLSGRLDAAEAEAFGHGLYFIADSVSKAGVKKRMFGLLGQKTSVGNRELVNLLHRVFVEKPDQES